MKHTIDKSLLEYEIEWLNNNTKQFEHTEISFVKIPDDERLKKQIKKEDKKNG